MVSNFTRQGPAIWAPGAPPDLFPVTTLYKPIRYLLSGITRDSAGTALGNCILEVYETVPGTNVSEPKGRLVNMTTSDANGNYNLEVHSRPGATFRVDAYKAGAPDLAGTTKNTLTATVS